MQFSCYVDPVHKHHAMEIKFHILTLVLNGKSSSTDACVL